MDIKKDLLLLFVVLVLTLIKIIEKIPCRCDRRQSVLNSSKK